MEENMIKISECTVGTTYVVDSRLRFEDGRLFITQTPYQSDKQSDFPEKIDVTEDVLDVLLKILKKRGEEANQNSIVEQLKNRV